ncbi:MAG: hypothetical protein GTO35_04930, partial [Gammaproteobacteria bacterium]|nr:hypothetical protein [Gammaproteobacteria bacterium]
DVIQYDSDDNGSIDALAFIHGRTSSTEYTVKDKNGNAPTAVTSDYDWAIYRAYTSLANWESQTENPNITEPVENDVNPSPNLAAYNTIMNVACYGDGADTTSVNIDGWTTGANNYIKIYTPYLSSEVGASQRHNGKWDNGKYRLEVTSDTSSAISDSANYIRIEGLQVSMTVNANANDVIYFGVASAGEVWISKCIIKAIIGGTATNLAGISSWNASASLVVKIWNNIFYDFIRSTAKIMTVYNDTATTYAYNNTLQNVYQGFRQDVGGGTFVVRNNIVQDASDDGYVGTFDGSSDYNISNLANDAPSPSYRSNLATAVNFADKANDDFHLVSTDTGAKDYGADLSSDTDLAFSDDIDGETRPTGPGTWDIGADEYIIPATTTLGDGTDPGNSTVAPGSVDQYLDQFTFVTDSGSDSVSALTVTTANTAAIASMEIWNDALTTQYFSTVSSPVGNDWSFSGGTPIPVTTSSASFRVRFTAKDHAALAAGTYAVTGTVTSFTCTNSQGGTDTDSATITVDNDPPADASWGTITPGNTQIELNWSNPGDADFNKVLILRRAGSAVGDAPTDGTEYNVN